MGNKRSNKNKAHKQGKTKDSLPNPVDYGITRRKFYQLLKKACQSVKYFKSDSETP